MDLQDSPRWPPVASERRQPSLLESSYSLYMTCFSSFVPPSPAACPPACGQPPIIPCCPLASSLPCGFSYSPSPSGHTPALPWAPHPLSISPLTPRTRIWQSQPHFLDGHLRQKPAGHSPCRAAPPSSLHVALSFCRCSFCVSCLVKDLVVQSRALRRP